MFNHSEIFIVKIFTIILHKLEARAIIYGNLPIEGRMTVSTY